MKIVGFIPSVIVAAVFVWAVQGCSGRGDGELVFEVTFPQGIQPHLAPVTLELPSDLVENESRVWEVAPQSGKTGERIFAQAGDNGTGGKYLTFLWRPAPDKNPERFVLRRTSESPQSVFEFADLESGRLTLLQDRTPVIGYIYGMYLKEGVPEDRRRSSYFHPVYGLDGEVLSDDFPEDHYHHRGIFWTWPQVFVGSDSLSLWDIRGIYQRFETWLARETGPVFARLGIRNGWYVKERKVVDETVWVKVFRAGETGRILDFELTWTALEGPVTLLGSPDIKGYGGFSFRFAPFEEPAITTSGGVQSEDSNRLPFPWADLSARFGGRRVLSGAALFDNPGNIGFPNGWCLRHYGFVGIAWPGIEPFTLEPGVPLKARYRVWLHRGGAEQGMVASAYMVYEKPLKAAFIE